MTAAFLMRCLFTLFAQDIVLLKKDDFTELLHSVREQPAQFVPLVETLWRDMNSGSACSVILRQPVLRFNGGLFAEEVIGLASLRALLGQGEKIREVIGFAAIRRLLTSPPGEMSQLLPLDALTEEAVLVTVTPFEHPQFAMGG